MATPWSARGVDYCSPSSIAISRCSDRYERAKATPSQSFPVFDDLTRSTGQVVTNCHNRHLTQFDTRFFDVAPDTSQVLPENREAGGAWFKFWNPMGPAGSLAGTEAAHVSAGGLPVHRDHDAQRGTILKPCMGRSWERSAKSVVGRKRMPGDTVSPTY
jgi:hypothetical protein